MIQASSASRQAENIFFPHYRVICRSSSGVVSDSGLGEQYVGCSSSDIRGARIDRLHLDENGYIEFVFKPYQKRLEKIYVLCGRSEELTSLVSPSGPITFTVLPDPDSVENGAREGDRGLKKRLWGRSVEVPVVLRRDIPRSKLPVAGWFALDCGDLELDVGCFYRVRLEIARSASRGGIPEDAVWIYGCDTSARDISGGAVNGRMTVVNQFGKVPRQFSEDFQRTYIPLSAESAMRSSGSIVADFVPLYELGMRTSLLDISRTIHARDEMVAHQGFLDPSEALLQLGEFDNLVGLCQVRLKASEVSPSRSLSTGTAEILIRQGKGGGVVSSFSFNLKDCYSSGWLQFSFEPIYPAASGLLGIEVRLKLDAGALLFDGFLRGEEKELVIPGRSVLEWNNAPRPPAYSSGARLAVPFVARCGDSLFSHVFGWHNDGFTPHRVKLYGKESFHFTFCVPYNDLRLIELPLFHPQGAPCVVQIDFLQSDNVSKGQKWIELLKLECISNSREGGGVTIALDAHDSRTELNDILGRIEGEWLRIHLAAPSQSYNSAVEVVVNEVPVVWGEEKNFILHHPLDERIVNIVNLEYRELSPRICWSPWGAVKKRARVGSSLANYRLAVLSSGREEAIFAKFYGNVQEAGGEVRRFRDIGESFWEYIANATCVLLGEIDHLPAMTDHIQMLRHFGIPVVEIGGPSLREKKVLAPQWGDLAIVSPSDGRECDEPFERVLVWDSTRPQNLGSDLAEQLALIHARRWPSFSVVAEYDGNSEELHTFLSAWNRQRYSGELEVLLIYTHAETNVYGAIEQWVTAHPSHRLDIQVVTNLSQRKLSVARNKAVNTAQHEVLIMTDLSQLPERLFLEHHSRLYTTTGCDAVFGDSDPDVDRLGVPSTIGDYSYLRCAFGTSSFRKGLFEREQPIFDEDDEDSGTGPIRWDEIELGIKLANKRCYIESVGGLLSRAIKDRKSCDSNVLSAGLKELYRLIKKYPEFEIECRLWITALFAAFQEALSDGQVPNSRESEKLTKRYTNVISFREKGGFECQRLFLSSPFSPYLSTLRLSSHRFSMQGSDVLRRGMRKDYDLAIVEIDEFLLSPFSAPERRDWRRSEQILRTLDEFGDRAVIVCLGMPEFQSLTSKEQEFQYEEYLRIRDYLKHSTVILPSYEAHLRWDFEGAQGYTGTTSVIWPGFDPAGYSKSLHQRLVLSHGPYIFSRPNHYGAYIFRDVAQHISPELPVYRLNTDTGVSEWDGSNSVISREGIYLARRDMERYSILLNTSAVTACSYRAIEGLLSGLIPVSVRSKDLELIVEHGRTGFLGDTAQELSEHLVTLSADMALCRRISDLSRARACELFHHERFLGEWEQVLRKVAGYAIQP